MKDAAELGAEVSFHDDHGTEEHGARKRDAWDDPEREAHLLRAGAALWGAVIREGGLPAEDTQAPLRAIRASLNAARRLRFAVDITESERRRQEDKAAEAAEEQAEALWLWYDRRGSGRGESSPAATGTSFRAESRHGGNHTCREITTAEEFRGLREE